jgi:hypothetical protein
MVWKKQMLYHTVFQLCFRICHQEGSWKSEGLEFNGTRQLLTYADNTNILGENIDITKKDKETLLDASKEIGLEVNAQKTKHMFMSHHQNTR